MPEQQGGYTQYTSKDKHMWGDGGDAWEALNAGMEITTDRNGFIIDVWDPETKEYYDSAADAAFDRDVKGTRETSYSLPPSSKPVGDMTDEELDDALRGANTDYNQECRAIREMQASLKSKDKKLKELVREKARRARSAVGKSGYQWRITPTTAQMIAAAQSIVKGRFCITRGVSTRSYAKRYIPGGRSSYL